MTDTSLRFHSAVLAKTATGQDEIKTRAQGLSPMLRRLLILVDGKHTGQELAAFVNGHPVDELLDALIQLHCIELVAPASGSVATPAPPSDADQAGAHGVLDAALAALPPADSRSALELAMARNFMINSVNMAFGQHMRMSFVKTVDECSTVTQLRQVYPLWLSTMAASSSAAKDLPTLKDKLFRVL